MTRPKSQNESPRALRCAVYTRKSTEDGLEQEFNSLDAQRESGEAYIKSQAWECLPTHYDDGGYTGANMDRPALRMLLADIEAGKVDAVVCYKIDRISRSLRDFVRLMELLDSRGVALVSVTQAFNTHTSIGRLTLNILMSFAEFERSMISERTRDKIAATRRKGKWSGGLPLLGYDVTPNGSKLVVNEDEAARVQAIFALYLQHQSIIATIQELDVRGWVTKRWVTRKGHERGGLPFTKASLWHLLTNVTYIGKLRYKDEVHEGEHAGIVDLAIWQQVQTLLQRNGRTGGAQVRNKFGAFLKGILRCKPCGCAMTPSHSTRGTKRYRYYCCINAQKRGWHNCPSKSIPAGEIERFVVDQIRGIGRDPAVLQATVAQARNQAESRLVELEVERRALERDVSRWSGEVRDTIAHAAQGAADATTARLADLQERIHGAERRATDIQAEATALGRSLIDEREVAQALAQFDPVWQVLTLREQTRVMQLLIECVEYDGATGDVAITFHPTGIKALTERISSQEDAA